MAQAGNINVNDLLDRIRELETRAANSQRRATPFNMPIYHGNMEESFLAFLDDYELFATLEGYTNERKAQLLPGFLRETALQTYREQNFTDAERRNWDTVKGRLVQRFVPPDFTRFHAAALATRNQKPGEDITKYATDLQQLVRSAYPTIPPDQRQLIIRDHFIRGLRKDIRRHILTTVPGATYAQALTIARNFDTGLRLANGVDGTSSSTAPTNQPQVYAGFVLQNPPQQQVNAMSHSGVRRGYSRGRRFQGRRGYSSGGRNFVPRSQSSNQSQNTNRQGLQFTSDGKPICCACKGIGHYRRDCPNRNNQTHSGSSRGNQNTNRGRSNFRSRGRGHRSRGRVNTLMLDSDNQEFDETNEYDYDEEYEEYDEESAEYENDGAEEDQNDQLQLLMQENALLRDQNQRFQDRETSGYVNLLTLNVNEFGDVIPPQEAAAVPAVPALELEMEHDYEQPSIPEMETGIETGDIESAMAPRDGIPLVETLNMETESSVPENGNDFPIESMDVTINGDVIPPVECAEILNETATGSPAIESGVDDEMLTGDVVPPVTNLGDVVPPIQDTDPPNLLRINPPKLLSLLFICITLFVPVESILIHHPMASSTSFEGNPTLYACPGRIKPTTWGLPRPLSCKYLTHTVIQARSSVKQQEMTLFQSSPIYSETNLTVCACTQTTQSILQDLFGTHKYLDISSSYLTVSEVDCDRMSRTHMSPYGNLTWNGANWETANKFEWSLPSTPLGCCRFFNTTISNCYIHYATIFKKDPFVLASSLGLLPPSCIFPDGKCQLPDGRYLLWKPTHAEPNTCIFTDSATTVPGLSLSHGTSYVWIASDASHILANSFKFNMSFCEKPNIFREFASSLASQTYHYTSTVTSSNLSLPAYLHRFHMACARIQAQDSAIRLGLQINPTLTLRQLLQRQNLHAYTHGSVVAITPCLAVPAADYTLLKPTEETTQFGQYPVRFKLFDSVWLTGFADPTNQVIYRDLGVNPLKLSILELMQLTTDDKSIIIYPMKLEAENPQKYLLDLPEPWPSYLFEDWIPYVSDESLKSFNTPSNRYEVYNYLDNLFPMHGYLPFGLQHFLLLLVLLYVILAALVLHCCPCYGWLKIFNPLRYSLKKLCKWFPSLYRFRFFQQVLPKHTKFYHEYLALTSTNPPRRTVFTASRRTLTIPDPCHSGPLAPQVPIYALENKTSPDHLLTAMLQIKLNKQPTKALLDTGATISLIHPDLLETLKVKEIKPIAAEGTSISGHPFPLVGLVDLSVKIGRRPLMHHQFHVAPDTPYRALLGLDIVKRLGPILLDVKNNALHLYSKQPKAASDVIALGEKQDEWQEWPLALVTTLVVPPRSEMFVSIPCPGVPDETEVLFESAYRNSFAQKGIALANSLACPKNGQIPIRMANVHDEPVKLYAGTRLGNVSTRKTYAKVFVLHNGKSDGQKSDVNTKETDEPEPDSDPLTKVDLSKSVLTSEQKKQLMELLSKYKDVFASSAFDIGCLTHVEHTISTGDAPPIRQRPYRTEVINRSIVDAEVKKMLDAGVIQHSTSCWASPIVLAQKKDGSLRFCIDYRKLNAVTTKDVFPLPLISEILDSLGAAKFFTSLDLAWGYWQIKMKESDVPKTAFVTYSGLYEFTRMPFGLTNAPATFQRSMQHVLAGLQPHIALLYIDDVLIHSPSFPQHLADIETILKRFRTFGLKLKPTKCFFARDEVQYLGHIITPAGLKPDPNKVKAVAEFPKPTDVPAVRRFLGMAGYYRRFIPHFARITRPLCELLRKETNFDWSEKCNTAFELVKDHLTTAPVLAYPDFRKDFCVESDASGIGIGAVLTQQDKDGHYHPIAYISRSLQQAERNYSVTEQECLAIHYALQQFRPYIYGRKCKVITDHQALKWLLTLRNPSGRLQRWALALQDYDLEIIYRSGKANPFADALSRDPQPMVAALPTLSTNNLVEEQMKDSFLAPIYHYLLSGTTPSDTKEKVRLEKLAEKYDLVENMLVLKKPHTRRAAYQPHRVAVPLSLRTKLIQEYHDSSLAGHLGIPKTLDSLQLKYYWPGMAESVREYVKSCPKCQTRKDPNPKPRHPLQPIPIEAPFHTIAMDITELPMSYNGNRYLLVFSDYFTKWVEAFALSDQKSETIARLFVEQIICRFGCPQRLLSDAAANFLSDIIKEICQLMRTKKITTSPFHPQTDGLVERYNRTLPTIMSMYVQDSHAWDEYLNFALFAARTTIQESTQESPFYLLFGQDPILPIDRVFNYRLSPYQYLEDLTYPEQLQARLSLAWQHAKEHVQAAQAAQKRQYDKKATTHTYNINDLVLVYRPNLREGRANKLAHLWDGPYTITDIIGHTVKIQKVGSNTPEPFRYNTDRLKPFIERSPHLLADTSSTDDAAPVATNQAPQDSAPKILVGPAQPQDASTHQLADPLVGPANPADAEPPKYNLRPRREGKVVTN